MIPLGEEENAKLKLIVADLSLYKVMLRDALSKKALRPARMRMLVDTIREDWKALVRPTCAVLKIEPSLYV